MQSTPRESPSSSRSPLPASRDVLTAVASLALAACLILPGCGAYRLRGVVLEGPAPQVMVVDSKDSRLRQAGIDQVQLELTLDPSSMRPKRLSSNMTDELGRFDIPIDESGAGVLMYELGVFCHREGYRPLWENLPQLPASNRRLIIILQGGPDEFHRDQDIVEETMRVGKELLK